MSDDSIDHRALPTVSDTTAPRYATFTRRARALVFDAAITSGAIVVLLFLSELTDGLPASGRVIGLLMLGVFLLYEPLFVASRGATIGHAAAGLTIVDDRTGTRPGFVKSFARYFVKMVLGLPSFVTMAISRRHQAVHDLLTRTTVQLSATAEDDALGFHLERAEESGIVTPPAWRRIVVIAAYLVAVFVIYGIVLSLVDPDGCARGRNCVGATRVIVEGVGLLWLTVSLGLIIAGWKGLLFGARYRRQESSEISAA